jgi:hypothetical protein
MKHSVRYFLYRPEGLSHVEGELRRVVDWEADADLSALVGLAVRLLVAPGRKAKKPDVYWLPLIESTGGATQFRRAVVLCVPHSGATAILSQVRLPALRDFLAWSINLSPHRAPPAACDFAKHVAREASAVRDSLVVAGWAPVE